MGRLRGVGSERIQGRFLAKERGSDGLFQFSIKPLWLIAYKSCGPTRGGLMIKLLVWVFLFIGLIFLFTDDPESEARLLANRFQSTSEKVSSGWRQGDRGLKVAISRDDRREGRRVAVLLEDWLYCDAREGRGDVFVVPKGYVTDFASIPWPGSAIINPFGYHLEAAVIHDWLYAVGETGERAYADGLFRFAMKEQRVNRLRRNVMWSATRGGGKRAYGRADEWRFWDPENFALVAPPIEKPSRAAVATIDCADMGFERRQILRKFRD